MDLFIDALFGVREGFDCPASERGPDLLTVDSDGVRDLPPYALEPKIVAAVLSDGTTGEATAKWFSGDEIYEGLGKWFETLNMTWVWLAGWHLDQTVIPALAANAFLLGRRFPRQLCRNLSEKWSKIRAVSLERAFVQDWYPENRDRKSHLSLGRAAELAGQKPPEDFTSVVSTRFGAPDGDVSLLLARCACMSLLLKRYIAIAGGV